MQPQETRKLQILNVKHATAINLPRLETRNGEDIADGPLAVVDMVPVAGGPLAGAYLGAAVYQRRPRLEVHAGLRVNGAVIAEPRRQQADCEGAQADEEGEEVRVGDVAVAGEVMSEVWPVDDRDEGVDQVEVVGHENVDERPRT